MVSEANLGIINDKNEQVNNAVVDNWLLQQYAKRSHRNSNAEIPYFSPLFAQTLLPQCMPLFNVMIQPPYKIRSIVPIQLIPLKVRITIVDPGTGRNISIDGMVCDDSFDQVATQIVCRSTGKDRGVYLDNISWKDDHTCELRYQSEIYSIPCTFILDDVICANNLSSLLQCTHNGLFSYNCGSNEHINILCN